MKQMSKGAMIRSKDLEEDTFKIKIRFDHTESTAVTFAGMSYIPMALAFGLSTTSPLFTLSMWLAVMGSRFTHRTLVLPSHPSSQSRKELFQTKADVYKLDDVMLFQSLCITSVICMVYVHHNMYINNAN